MNSTVSRRSLAISFSIHWGQLDSGSANKAASVLAYRISCPGQVEYSCAAISILPVQANPKSRCRLACALSEKEPKTHGSINGSGFRAQLPHKTATTEEKVEHPDSISAEVSGGGNVIPPIYRRKQGGFLKSASTGTGQYPISANDTYSCLIVSKVCVIPYAARTTPGTPGTLSHYPQTVALPTSQ